MAIVINSAWDAKVFNQRKQQARMSINSNWDAQQYYKTYGGNGQAGNYGSHEWLSSQKVTTYTYNPVTKRWTPTTSTQLGTGGFKSPRVSSSLGFKKGSGSVSQSGVSNSAKGASTSSKTKSEKDYIETEFNILTGDIELIPTLQNMKIKVGNTIRIEGVGKYLSGLYFVSEIKRRIDADQGYSLSATLYKNGFGDNLKTASITATIQDNRVEIADISSNVVNNSFKVGDKVKIVGDNATYAFAYDGVKVPTWVKNEVLTIDAFSNDGLKVRLNPIWSWTYTKFLQRQ